MLPPPELNWVAAEVEAPPCGEVWRRTCLAWPRPLSVLEERFLALCESSGIVLPEVNETICGLKVDALWRDQRLVVELDGYAAHGGRAAIEQDRGRELRLRAAGYVVLRYTWQQVTGHPLQVTADLRAALAARELSASAPARRG